MLKRSVIIVVLFLFSSCTTKTLYNYSDVLLVHYVNSLVSVHEPLYDRLQQSIKSLHSWHRKTQLPVYAEWLGAIRRDVDNNRLNVEATRRYALQLDSFISSFFSRLFSDLKVLMPSMNRDEVDELMESFEHQNQEFYTTYVRISDEDRQQRYREKTVKLFEDILGDLSKHQLQLIDSTVAKMVHTARDRYLKKLAFQRQLKIVLTDSDMTRSNKEQALEEIFKADLRAGTNIKGQHQNRELFYHLIADMVLSMSKSQQEHLDALMNDYIQLMQELAVEKN